MDKLNKVLWWIAVPPALIGFWLTIATVVRFQDRVEYVLDTVTPDIVDAHEMDHNKLHYLWTEAEDRK